MRAASDYHGSQCVVVAIDARRVSQPGEPARWEVFTHGGRKATGLDAVTWARRMAAYGAGEILLTSMDRDGTKSGFDLELTRAVSDAVPVPVIASGGVGNLQHLADGVTTGRASSVLAASIFHFGQHTVRECKQFMAAQGIPTGCDPPRALRASLKGRSCGPAKPAPRCPAVNGARCCGWCRRKDAGGIRLVRRHPPCSNWRRRACNKVLP